MGTLPPHDSGWAQPEDEKSFWGSLYMPNPNYPGNMPPGTVKENSPMEDLPQESRVPFPHYQVWPWHYRFGILKKTAFFYYLVSFNFCTFLQSQIYVHVCVCSFIFVYFYLALLILIPSYYYLKKI